MLPGSFNKVLTRQGFLQQSHFLVYKHFPLFHLMLTIALRY